MTPEGKVKKKVKEYLQSIGAWYYMPVFKWHGAFWVSRHTGMLQRFLYGLRNKITG